MTHLWYKSNILCDTAHYHFLQTSTISIVHTAWQDPNPFALAASLDTCRSQQLNMGFVGA